MAEAFNTLESSRILRDAGFEQKMAEAVVSQINGAVSGNVATKSDIELLQKDLERLASKDKVNELKTEIKSEVNELKTEIKGEFNDLKVEMHQLMNIQLKWIIGTGITVGSLLFAALKFFG